MEGLPRRSRRARVAGAALTVIDGTAGLRRAVGLVWPRATIQRCCVHTLRDLERKAPKHALAEIRADFHRTVYGASGDAACAVYAAFRAHVGHTLPGRGDEPARSGDLSLAVDPGRLACPDDLPKALISCLLGIRSSGKSCY